jgi:hypothetical protein
MAVQNLVSAVISPELKTSVVTKITDLKNDLSFITSIPASEKRDYIGVGNSMLPFLDNAYNTAVAHPEILSAIFDKDEFLKDYQLAKNLLPIANALNELTSAVQNTLFAAQSDAMVASLEVYASVKQNENKIAGLDTVAAQMKGFFKKAKKKEETKPQ